MMSNAIVGAPAGRMATALAGGFGFLLQFNILLQPFGLYFFHITDPLVLAGAALLPLLAVAGAERIAGLLAFVPLLGWLALVAWLAAQRGDTDFYNRAFLYAYALCGAFFMLIASRRPVLLPFCIGTTLGALASITMLILDAATSLPLGRYGLAMAFDPQETLRALAAHEAAPMALRLAKAGGLWIAGNEAGPALALAAPAAAYWSERWRSLAPFLTYLAAMLIGFIWTQNRASLIAVALIAVILALRMFTTRRMAGAIFGIGVLAASGLIAASWTGGGGAGKVFEQRLLLDNAMSDNMAERAQTTAAGFAIALDHPAGMSYPERAAAMRARTGLATPHNGFISIATYLGLPFAAVILAAVLFCLLRGPRREPFAFPAAIALVTGLSFEELHSNPVFQFYNGLVIGVPLALLAGYWRRRHARQLVWCPG